MQTLQLAPPSARPIPFEWRPPTVATLVGLAVLAAACWMPVRARRDLRIAILTGSGLALLLQGICFLK
jgi:hypothetical protein